MAPQRNHFTSRAQERQARSWEWREPVLAEATDSLSRRGPQETAPSPLNPFTGQQTGACTPRSLEPFQPLRPVLVDRVKDVVLALVLPVEARIG
jgi:hypothetical protein